MSRYCRHGRAMVDHVGTSQQCLPHAQGAPRRNTKGILCKRHSAVSICITSFESRCTYISKLWVVISILTLNQVALQETVETIKRIEAGHKYAIRDKRHEKKPATSLRSHVDPLIVRLSEGKHSQLFQDQGPRSLPGSPAWRSLLVMSRGVFCFLFSFFYCLFQSLTFY